MAKGEEEYSRVRQALAVSAHERSLVDAVSSAPAATPPSASGDVGEGHPPPHAASFFEGFVLGGIRVDSVQPGLVDCSFTVPSRLTDRSGCLAAGAVVSLVDEVGSAASIADGRPLKVSTDMSVSFVALARARPGDRLRVTARALGHKGAYSGTHVLISNAATGEVVAEGRHSLFGKMKVVSSSSSASTASKL
ncbi:acyl-coenzyme A thioesterase 13-like [Oryza brachyantha]|uniref:Acyl-coenzyme A thioesterase 13 n=1 Tax=Oryza brachyantha TaxID=4533 RepID=J3LDB4_ORYBR|nr:acyl-coenzyme A thioesterase 13-like [Oryza brachyantha]